MKRRLFTAGAALLLALGFASATFLAVRQPLSLGDYLAVWGLKARAIHASGDLAAVFRVDPAGEFSHPEYPPLWPLVLAGSARLLGRYDELLLTLLRPLLLALAACLTIARTRAPLPWRLLASATLTLLPYFQTAAYTGYAEALLLVLVLAALLLALAALTKQEGVFVLLVVAALLSAGRRFRDAAVVAGTGLGLGVVPWALYRAAHGVSGLADFRFEAFGRLGESDKIYKHHRRLFVSAGGDLISDGQFGSDGSREYIEQQLFTAAAFFFNEGIFFSEFTSGAAIGTLTGIIKKGDQRKKRCE